MSLYPAGAAARDRFVLDRRPPRRTHDPWRAQGLLVEDERAADGTVARVATVFLTGRECPWRCVMCDLWQHTTESDTPRGRDRRADRRRARSARRSRDEPVSQMKLYNAGSFFDPRAVPEADYDAIAASLAGLARVIVESHPALVGARTQPLSRRARRHQTAGAAPPALEVAMGLETAHPDALERLNKRMTVDGFVRAADRSRSLASRCGCFCSSRRRSCRTPNRTTGCCARSTSRCAAGASVDLAHPDAHRQRRARGARRGRAGSARRGSSISSAACARSAPHAGAGGRVFADLWDLERFADCPALPGRAPRTAARDEPRAARSAAASPARTARRLARSARHDALGRRRRRDRRLRLRGRVVRARAPAAGPARRAHRTRPASAIRHRRVLDAADQPAARRAGRSLRPAADSVLLEMGHVAAGASRRRLRPQARIHVPLPSARRARSPTTAITRGSCSSRRAPTTMSPTRIGTGPISISRWSSRRRRRARSTSTRRASRRIRDSGTGMTLEGTRHGRAVEITRRLRDRRQRPARLPHDGARHRQRALALAAADAGAVHALRGRRALGRRARRRRRAAVPAGRGRAPPRVSGRLDLGAALQQRHHERRRRADRSARRSDCRRPRARRRGTGCSTSLPSVREQFRAARATLPFVHAPRVAFRCREVVGESWALLPSAAGVIDPLLSTGFPLTLLGIARLLDILETTAPGAERRAALGRVRARPRRRSST